MYQYLCYVYHLVYILATVCTKTAEFETDIDVSFKFRFLCILFSIPLNKADMIFATQGKLFLESNYRYQLCQTRVKLLAPFSHTAVNWKHQRCKCTMVYLKDSFIESSFLFLFIHNIALLQGLVITTGVRVKNT